MSRDHQDTLQGYDLGAVKPEPEDEEGMTAAALHGASRSDRTAERHHGGPATAFSEVPIR